MEGLLFSSGLVLQPESCIGSVNAIAGKGRLFPAQIFQREIRNLVAVLLSKRELSMGCPKPLSMGLGVKCLIDAPIQTIMTFTTMEVAASKWMTGGKIFRSFMKIWEIVHMGELWIAKIMMAHTVRKTVNGPLGESNMRTGVTTDFFLRSVKLKISLYGQRNMGFLYPLSETESTETVWSLKAL